MELFFSEKIKKFIINYYISKKFKVIIGKNSKVNLKTILEGRNVIGFNTEVSDSYIGFATYIANNSIIRKAKIGKFCAIGDNVRTCLGLHPTKYFVSIHPAFFSLKKQAGFTFVDEQLFEEHKYVDDDKKYVVQIGNDVWVGNNVIIMDGIKISDGAIIAAGAIVTKDIEPYSIVGGIPAKLIKKRFTDSQIEKLLKIRWWDWTINKIEENINFFSNIDLFIENFINNE